MNVEIIKQLGAHVKQYVSAAMESVTSRVSSLEKALSDLPQPVNGRDGIDGAKGEDGKSITVDDVAPIIADAVRHEISKVPVPVNGIDGAKGEDGKSITVDDVRPLIIDEVRHEVSRLAPARDGRDGKDGRDGIDGAKGEDGKDGAKGEDGKDGVTVEDMEISLAEDERTILISLKAGEQVFTKSIKLPIMIDRGVYSPSGSYEKGDMVTYNGAYWICKDDTQLTPGGNTNWRLAVRKGVNGKDGKDGINGRDGKDGRPGKDLTKW